MTSLERKVLATIRARDLLPETGGLVLAVSGGPDSLAMLHAVTGLCRRRFPDVRLTVAHLNHGIRKEAGGDARFVRAQARALGLPCRVGRADVPARAGARGIGIEQAGREARYAFLESVARRVGATHIATAHHADDQAETVLMRVRRGAGPRGLSAIPYLREAFHSETAGSPVRIVRPLLDVTRREIEDYLRRAGLRPRLDATNLSPDPLRNRVRLRALPALERAWPSLRRDLLRVASAAQALCAAAGPLRAGAAPALFRRAGDCLVFDAAAGRRLPASLLADAVGQALRETGLWRRMFERRHFISVVRLFRRSGAVSLPGGLTARRTGDAVVVHPAAPPPDDEAEAPLPPRRPGARSSNALIEAEVLPGSMEWLKERPADGTVEFADYDRIAPPLCVRPVRAGDRMRPLGMRGRRKVGDILTDLRLPLWERRNARVLTAGGAPIWILGARLSDDVKLTPQTRLALRLTWRRG